MAAVFAFADLAASDFIILSSLSNTLIEEMIYAGKFSAQSEKVGGLFRWQVTGYDGNPKKQL